MAPLKYLLAILLVVCLTILTFAFINRGRLCELNIKNPPKRVSLAINNHYWLAVLLNLPSVSRS